MELQKNALTVSVHLILENLKYVDEIKITEVAEETCLALTIKDIIDTEPIENVNYNVVYFAQNDWEELKSSGINVSLKSPTSIYEQSSHLIVLSNAIRRPDVLKRAIASLASPECFILTEEDINAFNEKHFRELDLEILSNQEVPAINKKYLILRKPIKPDMKSTIIEVRENNYEWIDNIKNAISTTSKARIYLVSYGNLSGVIGLLKCLLSEVEHNYIRAYHLQDSHAELFSLSSPFYADQLKKDLVQNVLKPKAQWGTFRHLILEPIDKNEIVENAYVSILNRGDFSSLVWTKRPTEENRIKENVCTVSYAAVNLQDFQLASGNLPLKKESRLGFEFSGRNVNGKRVMGIAKNGCMATSCIPYSNFLWELPDTWTLEEAATVPVAYALTYYALIVKAKLCPGNTILIADGGSNIGHACISIALSMDCLIFTTASTESQRDRLIEAFPQLDSTLIRDSIDSSMINLIMNRTNQKGINVIVDVSKSNNKVQQCLSFGGCSINIKETEHVVNVFQRRNTNTNLITTLLNSSTLKQQQVAALVSEGISNGVVKPLPALVYDTKDIENAFKSFANVEHNSKVLVKVQCDNLSSNPKTVTVIPTISFDSEKCYIIVGGLGGFGLELVNWLIMKGATKFVITSRFGVQTGYQSYFIRHWCEQGIQVAILTDDASTLTGARDLLKKAAAVAPIGGIFNLAVILKDALIENQTIETYEAAGKPKIEITKNLHNLSKELVPSLEHFVVFSSVACGRGNAGQSNYSYANSVVERLCESRRCESLPGLAIQWGAVGDVGILAETLGNDKEFLGTIPQRMYSCLAALETFLLHRYPVVSSFVRAEKSNFGIINENCITEVVAKILGVKSAQTTNQNTTLADLGMDSFMGTEVKQILKRNYNLTLTAQEIRQLTFAQLLQLTSQSSNVPANAK